jgi:heme/copper-type cytochrome/quinol oxidase subunit 4
MMSTATLFRTRATAVWVLLIVATIASWILGTDHGISNHTYASIAILLIAFIKVRFVGLYFMELREAPAVLRGLFEAYCFMVCTAVIVLFVLG